MALDSKAQQDDSGILPPRIVSVPMPQAMGVNLFTQDITWLKGSVFESCFPPISAYSFFFKFLQENPQQVGEGNHTEGRMQTPVRSPCWFP